MVLTPFSKALCVSIQLISESRILLVIYFSSHKSLVYRGMHLEAEVILSFWMVCSAFTIYTLWIVRYFFSSVLSFFRAVSKLGLMMRWRGMRNLHISSSAFSVPSMKALIWSCFL